MKYHSSKTRNISKVHRIRRNNICLFHNITCLCRSNGNLHTEKNHIISKSSILKTFSSQNRVMIFDIEQKDYYKNGGKLVERNINNANVYRVLCGNHDRLLFNKIENNIPFDLMDKEQCFQYALRAFLFYYSEGQIKENFHLVDSVYEIVAKNQNSINKNILNLFKKSYENKNWNVVETKVITLPWKVEFASCFYTRPIWGINKMFVLSCRNIAFNVFPQGDETIIIMSYLKGYTHSIENYCEKLIEYSKNDNADKLLKYLNKIIIVYDKNIALNPQLVNKQIDKMDSFYEFSHLFKQNNRGFWNLLWKTLKMNFKFCKFDLFMRLEDK